VRMNEGTLLVINFRLGNLRCYFSGFVLLPISIEAPS
jgi:hypothetical protein